MRRHPCVILGYSRIDSLIDLIKQADKVGFNPIYISIDGPSNHEIARIQEIIKKRIDQLTAELKSEIVVNFRGKNLGLAAGIISGIDWFFTFENYGAILEDDLVLSDDFIRFVEFGESYLESNRNCLLVSGCRFSPLTGFSGLTNYPLIWGWATSRLNWSRIRSGLLRVPSRMFSFNSRINYWMVGSRRVHDGLVDTWDIPLVSFMLKENLSCLIPPVNLTTNIGYDVHAAHTTSFSFPLGLPFASLSNVSTEMLHPINNLEIENQYLDRHVYFIKTKHKFLSIIYWLSKPFEKPRYPKLQSRILDV